MVGILYKGWSGYGTHWLDYTKLSSGAYGWIVEAGNEARPVRNYTGSSDSHNNTQPYNAIYMYRRTA